MIASNKQKQKHNNLVTIWRKTQGSPWALQAHPICKHLKPKMQSLTKMNTVVIEGCYLMTIMAEKRELDETNTYFVKISSKP
jgi:hypothetical protein